MTTETEHNFSVMVGHSKLNKAQLAFAIRDYLMYIDPNIGLVYVSEVPEIEDSTVAYHYDLDIYPQMGKAEKGRLM
jgi:hypothetical protein